MRRRTFLAFCFLLFAITVQAQWSEKISGHGYAGPEYALQWNKLSDIDAFLAPDPKGFPDQLEWIGLSFGVPVDGRYSVSDGLMHVSFLNRNDLYTSDSLRHILNGFRFGMLAGHDLLDQVDLVDLILLYGLTHNRVYLRRDAPNKVGRYVNPAFLLDLKIDAHLAIPLGSKRHLSIGAKAGYAYDISSRRWKRKTDMLPELPKTRLGGFEASVFIGIGRNYE